MSSHVAPHRWADLWAGRVDEVERGEMERHAAACRSCSRVRQRVTRASDSFAQIRSQSSPDMSWDAVRARVHWSVSTERRAALREKRPAYGWILGALAAAGAIAVATDRLVPADEPVAHDAPRLVAPVVAAAVEPLPIIGLVSRASGDVMIDGVRPNDLFARRIARGNRIATGAGRVDIQFGDRTAIALGPNSTVELRRFDAQTVELVVDGMLDVAVAPRAANQRFLVDAGDQRIEVRGTQFRVRHDATTTHVACRHGLVTVRDSTGQQEVGDARSLRVSTARGVAGEPIVPLSADELASLADATPLSLALWDPAALERGSAPLEIATVGRRDVRVDGIELGMAPLSVRVMPGRHTVEAADSAGRYRRAGWVDVAAGPRGARLAVPAEPPATGGVAERRKQFRAMLDQPRLARCMRSIAKAGMAGSYVQVELSVDPRGAVSYMNIVDTDLPTATATCVRETLAEAKFAPGAEAAWRETIAL